MPGYANHNTNLTCGHCVRLRMHTLLQGIIINGCIRDSADIAKMPLGVKALATYPLKSSKRDPGLQVDFKLLGFEFEGPSTTQGCRRVCQIV